MSEAVKRAKNSHSGRVGPRQLQILQGFKEWLYNQDPSKDADNRLRQGAITDAATEMAEDLEVVLDARKNAVLPWAIEKFNKIQGLQIKGTNVERAPTVTQEGLEMTDKLKAQLKGAEFDALKQRLRGDKLLIDRKNG